MPSTKIILVAQVITSCVLAFFMACIFGFMAKGPMLDFMRYWGLHFIFAWPVAFCLVDSHLMVTT
ncbi:MAG: DUF2798 domain-containing protein [Bacteriovoracaceae bacterium]|nr:DUF2798 domain-containing protein [Bacteriovoracaceae bacterium]